MNWKPFDELLSQIKASVDVVEASSPEEDLGDLHMMVKFFEQELTKLLKVQTINQTHREAFENLRMIFE